MEYHATKFKIIHLSNESLGLIDVRKLDSKWGKKLLDIGNQLSAISKEIDRSRSSAKNINKMHLKQVGGAYRYQINQKLNSKLTILEELDNLIALSHSKTLSALCSAQKNNPDKTFSELAGIYIRQNSNYKKQLTELETIVSKLPSSELNSDAVVQLRHDMSLLKTQHGNIQGGSLLALLAIFIRILALIWAIKNDKR